MKKWKNGKKTMLRNDEKIKNKAKNNVNEKLKKKNQCFMLKTTTISWGKLAEKIEPKKMKQVSNKQFKKKKEDFQELIYNKF